MAIKDVLFDLDGTLWNLVHMDDWTDHGHRSRRPPASPRCSRLAFNAPEFIPEFFLDLAASQGTQRSSTISWRPSRNRLTADG
jgi:hypothetical protein